jgi:hypothetical protein
MTAPTALQTLDELDQELRRHIGRLLEIACDDWQVSNLFYDAIQQAARTGQACRALQHELKADDPAAT